MARFLLNDVVNIKTWDIDGKTDISKFSVRDYEFLGDRALARTELEMNVAETEELIHYLQKAVLEAKRNIE